MDTLRILLLEDNPLDAELTLAMLSESDHRFDVVQVETAEEFRGALDRQTFDLILADYNLPAFDGVSALRIANDITPSTPFIFVSGTLGEELAIETLKNGATDYVVKQRLERLVPSVKRALREAQERLERQRAEMELKQAKEMAEAANRAKDQFLATLSHELRTPLTPVLASIYALEEIQGMPEAVRPLVNIIRRNIELEARLIDDLLDLTRVTKGKLRLNIQPVDAHTLIDHVVENCRADIEAKDLHVRLELSAVCHHVLADSARLQQIIWNLVKNAVKFTDQGGTVTISTGNVGADRFTMQVADDGIGIAPTLLPKIFDAFEQGDSVTSRRSGGLGLGLAITKALVDLHGGRLLATSDGLGHGATFSLEIATAPIPARKPAETKPLREARSGGENVRILIVDDHEDTRRVIQMLLERRGYKTLIAQSVSSALDIISSNQFDLLISDIGLPDGTGIDLLRSLTADGTAIKAIALSGYGMEEDIQRSKEAGFYEHLTKPVSIKKLQEVIDELVAGKSIYD